MYEERNTFAMMTVKGTGWLGNYEYFRKRYSQEDIEKVKKALAEKDREALFGKPVLNISQVDFGANVRFLVIADEILGKGDQQLIKEAAIYNAKKDLKGVYKLFISFVSPRYIIKRSSQIWSQYYNQGEAVATYISSKKAEVKVTNAPDIPKDHAVGTIAYGEEALRISGCKNPKGKELKCIANGDTCCVIEYEWD
jgi:hypothetical protein